MVIIPIGGVDIPTMMRIPYYRWDDHSQYKEFRPWHIYFVFFADDSSWTAFSKTSDIEEAKRQLNRIFDVVDASCHKSRAEFFFLPAMEHYFSHQP